jgi:hypothetical protein
MYYSYTPKKSPIFYLLESDPSITSVIQESEKDFMDENFNFKSNSFKRSQAEEENSTNKKAKILNKVKAKPGAIVDERSSKALGFIYNTIKYNKFTIKDFENLILEHFGKKVTEEETVSFLNNLAHNNIVAKIETNYKLNLLSTKSAPISHLYLMNQIYLLSQNKRVFQASELRSRFFPKYRPCAQNLYEYLESLVSENVLVKLQSPAILTKYYTKFYLTEFNCEGSNEPSNENCYIEDHDEENEDDNRNSTEIAPEPIIDLELLNFRKDVYPLIGFKMLNESEMIALIKKYRNSCQNDVDSMNFLKRLEKNNVISKVEDKYLLNLLDNESKPFTFNYIMKIMVSVVRRESLFKASKLYFNFEPSFYPSFSELNDYLDSLARDNVLGKPLFNYSHKDDLRAFQITELVSKNFEIVFDEHFQEMSIQELINSIKFDYLELKSMKKITDPELIKYSDFIYENECYKSFDKQRAEELAEKYFLKSMNIKDTKFSIQNLLENNIISKIKDKYKLNLLGKEHKPYSYQTVVLKLKLISQKMLGIYARRFGKTLSSFNTLLVRHLDDYFNELVEEKVLKILKLDKLKDDGLNYHVKKQYLQKFDKRSAKNNDNLINND